MRGRFNPTFVAVALLLASPPAFADEVRVGPGVYRPLYPPAPEESEQPVPAFLLDRTPVTNEQFAAFVRDNPRWRRERVSRLFADARYLEHWAAPLRPGPDAPARAPVVRVSWFAARAYCASLGKRLPSEREWELAAAASEESYDASRDPRFVSQLLAWYARPTPRVLPSVGKGPANLWGVRDLHGLIWEWVLDFGSTLVNDDSRAGQATDLMKFCGAAAASASGTKQDYASFMRLAFRSSLQADFTMGSLGFRCARDVPGDGQ